MAPPKRKKSLSKTKMRIRSIRRKVVGTCSCQNCGSARRPHRICGSCGYYDGRQVKSVTITE